MGKTKEEYNAYMKAYMARRYERRRAAAIKQLGGHCVACGSVDDLDFDHVDASTKSFVISRRLAGISETKLQVELKKCQLLCRDCHRKKTQEAGEHQRGSQKPTSKLTEAKVLEARRRWTPGSRTDGAKALAREFGVTPSTMTSALRRKTWKHI